MKAEYTRKAFVIMMATTEYPIPDFGAKKVDEELAELERLAEIGRATEKAYSKGAFLIYDVVEDSQQNIISYNSDKDIEDLIDWAKED